MTRHSRHILLLSISLLIALCAKAQRIGQWTSYLSYTSIRHVVDSPDRIYAATPKGLFYYDKEDFTLHTLSKGNGLSDVGIGTIAYDQNSKSLVIAFNNGNIDILHNDATHNISGIKQWVYSGNKSINAVAFNNNRAYFACAFGLVVVNLNRKEIEDTYYFSQSGGGNAAVYDVAFTDSLIYAATSIGLIHAKKDNNYLNIEESWTVDSSDTWSTIEPFRLAVLNNRLAIVATTYDPSVQTLLIQNSNGFNPITQGDIQSIQASKTHLIVSMWDSVIVYGPDFTAPRVIRDFPNGEMLAYDATESTDGRLWIGHDWAGVIVVDTDESTFTTSPGGPVSDNVYRIRPIHEGIAVCPGGKTSTQSNVYIAGNIIQYKGGEWSQLEKSHSNVMFYDVIDVAEDPTDQQHLAAASWGNGILDIKNNKLQCIYTDTNSEGTLHPFRNGSFTSLRTGAVAYDFGGNLWMTNSLSDSGLVVRRADGSWRAYYTQPVVRGTEIYNLLFDTVTGFLWFYGRDNRICVHNGAEKMSWIDPNNGSKLQTSFVNCMVQDQNGHLWIGTDKGIKVIYDGYKAFDNGGNGEMSPVSCSNILFSEGELVEYLLAYESITSIAVDGANRKLIGTAAGGLYLLSATGLEQLENFTVENSPLFSNKIVTVGIHPITGEVFVGTDMGLQSYRSTATFASTEPEKKIHVFPNPVRPDYDGPVAIRGFTRNAIVHITDEAGHVVYSTRADGGQAIWYIRSNEGVRVSSGVYFVFASDEEGRNKSVGKILVIK